MTVNQFVFVYCFTCVMTAVWAAITEGDARRVLAYFLLWPVIVLGLAVQGCMEVWREE